MKKISIILTIIVISIIFVAGDNIGTYKFKPSFEQTVGYNFLSDYDELFSSAKDIVSACEKSSDRRSCVQTKVSELNSGNSKLEWNLDSCQTNFVEYSEGNDWFYNRLANSLTSCSSITSASACVCGELQMPDLYGDKVQFAYRDGYTLMSAFNDGEELTKNRRSILIPQLGIYDHASKSVEHLDEFSMSSCKDKGYCDDQSTIRIIRTKDDVSFLKKQSTIPPYCKGFSPRNHFVFCVKTKEGFPYYNTEYKQLQNLPISYKFALTVGPERKQLKANLGDPRVVEELERQIEKDTYEFDSLEEKEKWREWVLASAFQEGQFYHFESDGKTVKLNYNPATSTNPESWDHGAMQINSVSHPGCFIESEPGNCKNIPECEGKAQPMVDDLVCNVAYGVNYHYKNYKRAKEGLYTTYKYECNGELDAFQLAMRFYQGGCTYPLIVEKKFDKIFEPETVYVSQTPATNPQPITPQPVTPTPSSGTCDDPQGLLTYVDKNIALSPSDGPSGISSVDGYAIGSVIEESVNSLIQTAANDGVSISVASGYRDYQTQNSLFYGYARCERKGYPETTSCPEVADIMTQEEAEARANVYSAYPGHSEHQLGTAIDFDNLYDLDPAKNAWLENNAHKFGFTISYPQGKEQLTGYTWEPWHLRYVGTSIAQELYDLGYLNTNNDWTLNKYLKERCGK